MAVFLRTRFLRNFTGMARFLSISRTMEIPKRLEKQWINPILQKAVLNKRFSTNVLSMTHPEDSNLDRSLRHLDEEVRRSSRISRNELEAVVKEMQQANSVSTAQSLLIIRCCGNLIPEEPPEIRTQLVLEIWNLLLKLGIPLDISHYNALLRVFLENEHEFSPTEFLAELEKRGIEPNRVTYQRLISRYCQKGDIDGATEILEFMRAKEIPINEHVFNALIMGHSQNGDMENAMGMINVMRQANLQPSAETFITLLCGYARLGDINAINSVMDQCKTEDIYLIHRDYMDIVYTLAVNGHYEHIENLLDVMPRSIGYNNDAINLILRLLNKRQFEVAKKILYSMSQATMNERPQPTGNFFIRHLVKAKYPVDTITEFCCELEQKKLNERALHVATEAALSMGDSEQSYALLLALKKEGYPVRAHYFWPVILSLGRSSDLEGLRKLLTNIRLEFNMQMGGESLGEYIVPSLISLTSRRRNKSHEIITFLSGVGVSPAASACALVHFLLNNNKIAEACEIANQYRAQYSHLRLKKTLLKAFYHTGDVDSFITMVHHMYDTSVRVAELNDLSATSSSSSSSSDDEVDDIGPSLDNSEFIGQIVLDVVKMFNNNKVHIVKEVLQKMVDQGFTLSNSTAERILAKFSDKELSDDISSLIEKLCSGELTLQPLEFKRSSNNIYSSMDERELKIAIQSQDMAGRSSFNSRRQLLSLYCKNKDLENAEQTKQELLANGFTLNIGSKLQLLDLYIHHGKLESALQLNEEIKSNPDFELDGIRVVKLATLLAQQDKIEDAVEFIKKSGSCKRNEEKVFLYSSVCRKLLDLVAEKGDILHLHEIFNLLHELKYFEINNSIVGPLVKVHLLRNDTASALNEFEQCCLKYRCTPCKNELACSLIKNEDAVALQRLTDLSSKIHGEVNSLYDLVFSFVESGRIRQAKRILETPGLRSRPQRINSICERYRHEGNIKYIEGLLDATKDLSYIDRSGIYQHLLLSYHEMKDAEGGLNLWTRMQEEDMQPSNDFLTVLGDLLQSAGLNVPFKIPEELKTDPLTVTTQVQEDSSFALPHVVDKFHSEVLKGNLRGAIQLQHMMSTKEKQLISKAEYSTLIEGLVKNSSLSELSTLLVDMSKVGVFPSINAMISGLTALSADGDVKSITSLDKYLSSTLKRAVRYNNKVCNAYIAADRTSEYLEELEKEINGISTANDIKKLLKKHPGGVMLDVLQRSPDYCLKYEKIAEKYAQYDALEPINILWSYFVIHHQYENAEQLWNKHLAKSPIIHFRHVLQYAHNEKDLELAGYLVNVLKNSSISPKALGFAYNGLIQLLLSVGDTNEAKNVFEEAKKLGAVNLIFESELENTVNEKDVSVKNSDKV